MDIHAARKIAHAIATPYARRFFLDLDDCRQVAWIAAWRAIESHDAARSKITTWIDRCVRFALSEFRRNSGEWGHGSPAVGSLRTGGRYAAVQSSEAVGRLLADGRPPGWVAVDDADEAAAICRRANGGDLMRRRYLAGESAVEIAASLGVHQTWVDRLLQRTIAEIRAASAG